MRWRGILRSTKIIRDPKENVAHWIDAPLPLGRRSRRRLMQQHEARDGQRGPRRLRQRQEGAEETHAQARNPRTANPAQWNSESCPASWSMTTQARKVGEWTALYHNTPTYIGDRLSARMAT